MASAPALSVLLSHTLVAFAIEFDNEFELQLSKTYARPFLTSIVMWSNFMRFVDASGVPVGELVALSCLPKEAIGSVVGGMERWGYITVDHDPANGVPPVRKGFGTASGLRPDTLIFQSMVGTLASERWAPLAHEIEERWKGRMGAELVEGLREALAAVQSKTGLVMPHFLPIVGEGGLFTRVELGDGASETDDELPGLLSRVLLAFTLDYERGSDVSLPVGANILRVLDVDPAPLKDLPSMAGVSKEAVSLSMTWLEKSGAVAVEPHPSARGKVVRLTSNGVDAQQAYHRRQGEVETDWETRFGKDAIAALRAPLEQILDQPGGEDGALSSGLVTPPGGWRGKGRYKAQTTGFIESPSAGLPSHPMVLHRGGWPDGS
jgi:hypothetical protein